MVRSHLTRRRAGSAPGKGGALSAGAGVPAQDSFPCTMQIQGLELRGEDAGGSPHKPVVPDALEEVQGLLQAVGLVVLPNDHVVAAAGHHEDDGSHIIEALDPLAALIALAAHIEHVEVDFVHLELGLKDSRSQDAAAEQVLKQSLRLSGLTKTNPSVNHCQPGAKMLTGLERRLCILCPLRRGAYLVAGHVVSLLDDVNLVQEAGSRRKTHGGDHTFRPICPLFLPSHKVQLSENDHPMKFIRVKRMPYKGSRK